MTREETILTVLGKGQSCGTQRGGEESPSGCGEGRLPGGRDVADGSLGAEQWNSKRTLAGAGSALPEA